MIELWTKIFPRVLSGIMSILQASNLRNTMFQMKDEHELMWTALDDIARMHPEHRAGQDARRILDKITTRYGR